VASEEKRTSGAAKSVRCRVIFAAYQNLFAPSTRCASLASEEFAMKAMPFVFVALAATLLLGCPEDKPTTPTPDSNKAAAPAGSTAPASAPAKPAEKKDEGGW
jgi:hypothetical protein